MLDCSELMTLPFICVSVLSCSGALYRCAPVAGTSQLALNLGLSSGIEKEKSTPNRRNAEPKSSLCATTRGLNSHFA